jgi:hypothetical protein
MSNDTDNWDILGKYIRARADDLGLSDWYIVLKAEPPEDKEAAAEICPVEGRKWANIRVAKDFMALRPEEQRSAIIHELVHCHFQSAVDIIRLDLFEERLLAHDTYAAIYAAFRRQMEYGVDGIAVTIALHFPLIEWEALRGAKE